MQTTLKNAKNAIFRLVLGLLDGLRPFRYINSTASTITFIIPTKGRSTLDRTLNSLLAQSDSDWKAKVVIDGVNISKKIHEYAKDSRISFTTISNPIGTANHAGLTRNFGIKEAATE